MLKGVLDRIGYWVLMVLLVFLIVATLVPDEITALSGQTLAIGVLSGLLAFLAYFDMRLWQSKKLQRKVLDELVELKSGNIRRGTFQDLFEAAMPVSNRVAELRVFALSTDKIFAAFYDSDREFRADKVSLLLHSSEKSESNLRSWKGTIPDRVREIDCVWYDSRPSSFYVIFDRDCMFFGGYYPANIPSGNYYKAPFLIRDRRVIDDYIKAHEDTMKFHRAYRRDRNAQPVQEDTP